MLPVIQKDAPLGPLNTFGVEVRAERLARIASAHELEALYRSPEWSGGPRLVLGGGSNLLFTHDYPGLVLHMAIGGLEAVGEDDRNVFVRAGAGVPWQTLVDTTLSRGWPGLENLTRIPGTVGAAPIQNIGAYGIELSERFAELTAFDTLRGTVDTLDAAACAFGYRDSRFKREPGRYIILSVTVALPKAWEPSVHYGEIRSTLARAGVDKPSPADIERAVSAIRASKLPDPAVQGNAGSFFKNPVVPASVHARLAAEHPMLTSFLQSDGRYKLSAAWLIDQCGWKGRAMGAAAVHERQPLVLINRGGATGMDVLALAEAVAQSVERRFGVALETEPLIL